MSRFVAWTRDPRHCQLIVLASLLLWNGWRLDFAPPPTWAAATLMTVLATQWGLGRIYQQPGFDPRSPLITGLSLCLLLRTPSLGWAIAAAGLAIASKFVLRTRRGHVFNPSNLAVVAMMAAGTGWASPGAWGTEALFALVLGGAGLWVVTRAARADVTLAFLLAWSGVLLGRAWWLGDPLALPLHQLKSGALVLFAFFMISDPKTTPETRAGRVPFAILVAGAAAFLEFELYRPHGFLWALAVCAPLTPVLDALVRRGSARRHRSPVQPRKEPPMRLRLLFPTLVLLAAVPGLAHAFCGFYVAQADSKLFNKSSRVVLARHEDRTVITMENDYRGDPASFAMVIPVPQILEREQIHIGDRRILDHLDAFTSPRLVEYFDTDPCLERRLRRAFADAAAPLEAEAPSALRRADGVTVAARYAVGEYDITILSAEEGRGLATWLRDNGYRLPDGADRILTSYIRQGLHFFVAKVDLERHHDLGFQALRPLQIAYQSPRFTLPLRLGTLNADGVQELFVFAITRGGRVEPVNYPTVKLPTGTTIPAFVKDDFASFYRDMFDRQSDRQGLRNVFLEYAWDMSWCDPCAADPLSTTELRELGAHWLGPTVTGAAADAFVTRLHLRYDAGSFPQDLVLHETADRSNFQGRYVLRHAWTGTSRCAEGDRYLASLPERWAEEARRLAELTGWSLDEIRARMRDSGQVVAPPKPWWQTLWR